MKKLLIGFALYLTLGCCCIPGPDASAGKGGAEESKQGNTQNEFKSTGKALTEEQAFEEILDLYKLPKNVRYPYWPLVYDPQTHGITRAYTSEITGTVTNFSIDRSSSILVVFDLYDHEDNKVGSCSDIIDDLGPGETWKYKCVSLNTDWSKYRGPYLKSRSIVGDPR